MLKQQCLEERRWQDVSGGRGNKCRHYRTTEAKRGRKKNRPINLFLQELLLSLSKWQDLASTCKINGKQDQARDLVRISKIKQDQARLTF